MIGKNNVFNIRNNRSFKWQGQTGSKLGFCEFDSVRSAVRACAKLIFSTYKNKYHCETYRDIIFRFAPPIENCTSLYLCYVCCNDCNLYDCAPSTILQKVDLLYRLARFETGSFINKEMISDVLLNDLNLG